MVKRKKISKTVPEPELSEEELDDDEDDVVIEPEEGGLTFEMRYTVGILKPQDSYEGSKRYSVFFETEKLSEAKSEALKAFKEDKLEVVVWDREKWCDSDIIRHSPEVTEVKEDEDVIKPRDRGRQKSVGSDDGRRQKSVTKKSATGRSSSGSARRSGVKKKIPPSKRKRKR
jgi:hypothetical protein